MAQIFVFKPQAARKSRAIEASEGAASQSAKILFFTGVRYERISDCLAIPPKPARTKKTGGPKPRRRA